MKTIIQKNLKCEMIFMFFKKKISIVSVICCSCCWRLFSGFSYQRVESVQLTTILETGVMDQETAAVILIINLNMVKKNHLLLRNHQHHLDKFQSSSVRDKLLFQWNQQQLLAD